MLSGFGYRVPRAASGGEALRIHAQEQGKVALVLTDLGMPGMGGEALLRLVRDVLDREKETG